MKQVYYSVESPPFTFRKPSHSRAMPDLALGNVSPCVLSRLPHNDKKIMSWLQTYYERPEDLGSLSMKPRLARDALQTCSARSANPSSTGM